MSADVLDIHDFLPAMIDPPAVRDEPATVIILPVIRIERAPAEKMTERYRRLVADDGLPSDIS